MYYMTKITLIQHREDGEQFEFSNVWECIGWLAEFAGMDVEIDE